MGDLSWKARVLDTISKARLELLYSFQDAHLSVDAIQICGTTILIASGVLYIKFVKTNLERVQTIAACVVGSSAVSSVTQLQWLTLCRC